MILARYQCLFFDKRNGHFCPILHGKPLESSDSDRPREILETPKELYAPLATAHRATGAIQYLGRR